MKRIYLVSLVLMIACGPTFAESIPVIASLQEKYSKVSFAFELFPSGSGSDSFGLKVTNLGDQNLRLDEDLIKRSLVMMFSIRYVNHVGQLKTTGVAMTYPVGSMPHVHTDEEGNEIEHSHTGHITDLISNEALMLNIDFDEIIHTGSLRFFRKLPKDYSHIDSVYIRGLLRNPFPELLGLEGVEIDFPIQKKALSEEMFEIFSPSR